MPSTKISVSVASEEIAWARKQAHRRRVSLSALVTEALRRARQAQARERLLTAFGKAAAVTPEELREIYREWQAD